MLTTATIRTRPMAATAARTIGKDTAAAFDAAIDRNVAAGLSRAKAIRAAVRECSEAAHREWLAAQQPRP